MSNLVFVYDEVFQRHKTPESHPESPDRLAAIEQTLHRTELIKQVKTAAPRAATPDELAVVHNADYIEELEKRGQKARSSDSVVQIDPDTWMSPESYDIAKLAAGAGLVAVESVARTGTSSFVAARPPGHHALATRAMGFCLFNNVAVAARYAQQHLGMKKVLIIDWDVHHGNGTQDMFFDDPSVCFISFHQYPFWPPDSGWYTEDGRGEGKGFNINIPMPAGSGDRGYIRAWDAIVTPIALEYKPDLILLSAGYDAHQHDPLGQQLISTNGYYLLSERLARLGEQTGAPVAAFLEGGYNTRTLAEAVATTMGVLNAGDEEARKQLKMFGGGYGGDVQPDTEDRNPDLVDERIAAVRSHLSKYWKSLRAPVSKAK
jgi:acetoin utilization deacetylase AcuC-like enzyme